MRGLFHNKILFGIHPRTIFHLLVIILLHGDLIDYYDLYASPSLPRIAYRVLISQIVWLRGESGRTAV